MDTYLLNGILRMKDSGEMGRDPCWKVWFCTSALIVEVYDHAGWVSDSVDEMSGDHWYSCDRDVCKTISRSPRGGEPSCIMHHIHQGFGQPGAHK